jgi:ribosomal-protein-alanine N-acetyltransferase
VERIASARLDLVSMTPEFMRASLANERSIAGLLIDAALPETWPGRTGRTMRYRLAQLEADPASLPWLLRAVVLRDPVRRVIGHIGFHAPPDARRAVEVGYTIEADYRRRGYAFEAVQALFGWAEREHEVHHFVASIAPSNIASLGLARKLGFVQTGSQWDEEDGEELVFELLKQPTG